jgi:trimeric autotransporter adhesin
MQLDNTRTRRGSWFPFLLAVGLAPTAGAAQGGPCSNPWLATTGVPGVLGGQRVIYATTSWDPDGPGPATARIVVAGDFTHAGTVAATRIAAFDPATNTWSALAGPQGQGIGVPGVSSVVRGLLAMPNGDLFVAGQFTTAGGINANHIARFDGTNWWPLGSGVSGAAISLLAMPNGDLVVGGFFTTAGGVAANAIARWNGSTWAPFGAGIGGGPSGGDVRALALLPSGDLIAGGYFSTAGGAPAANVARWNGSTWSQVGLGLDSAVHALLVRANGDLIAGGYFAYSGPSASSPWLNSVARFDGSTWLPLDTGLLGSIHALAEAPNGKLVAGCFQSQDAVLEWDGAAWTPIDDPTDDVGAVFALHTRPNGEVVAGGQFTRLGGIGAAGVAQWNGSTWAPLGNGITGWVGGVVDLQDGTIVAHGSFAVGSSRSLGVWTGSTWLPFPVPLAGITRIHPLPDGRLLAAGTFAGPGAGNNLAIWNGTAWSTFAPGLLTGAWNDQIQHLAVLPNGDIAASGTFPQRLALWNGTTWASLGTVTAPPWANASVGPMVALPNGDLVVAGSFATIGGTAAESIARYDGTAWSPLGSGVTLQVFGSIRALAAMPNGDIVVTGYLTHAGGVPTSNIARWNGTAWSPLGTGLNQTANVLAALPDGDLVAAGHFTTAGGSTVNRVARWNGAAWSGFGSGVDRPVHALTVRASGGLVLGGEFVHVDGAPSPFFAEITTTCPATAADAGPGCTGSGGPNVLTATDLPWLGATFRARATGLPPLSFALIASGVTPIVLPVSQLFPQGLPGCTAWVLADLIDVALPTAGAVTTQVPIPNDPTLVGASFRQQVLSFVFDPAGNFVELTNSNALELTLGVF